jgi:ATP-dependent HslUV protease subunit HslV
MLAADATKLFLLSGNGDVIEPDEGVIAIGSGGVAAQAAALAMFRHTELDAQQIARAAMEIAAESCVFTNHHLTIEELSDHAES